MPFFPEELTESAQIINEVIEQLIPQTPGEESKLFDAMRHSSLDGGKRLRPFLVLSSAAIFGVEREFAARVAAAVEFVHCYSLVHDDLPAMDDSPLRRGKPSTHKKYDEATAILAGDALLTLAFEILAQRETHPESSVRCELVRALAEASGGRGMVGGQLLDLIAEKEEFDVGAITRLQRLKTGKIMIFCCEAGAIIGRAGQRSRHALHSYGQALGLAFQVTDDLLDVEGDQDEMGKPANQDTKRKKATFVSVLGAGKAREQAGMLANQAIKHLEIFDKKADPLRDMAHYILERRV